MRLTNVAALSLEKNVVRVGGIKPSYHLVIPPEDVKNDQPLEYPLPEVKRDAWPLPRSVPAAPLPL
jgi:hypothetical protein